MNLIWTSKGPYRRVEYPSEADLEAAIIQVQTELFGSDRLYLDVKKKIGAKGGLRNIPDGYLLDLGGRKPRLYVVENELASHEPFAIHHRSLVEPGRRFSHRAELPGPGVTQSFATQNRLRGQIFSRS